MTKFLPFTTLGNNQVEGPLSTQTVDYYEVAVGTDRRYPKTRDNVVAFTNVGTNTSVTFEHLALQPVTSVYYVTVRAYSASFATAEVTSTGITPGVDSMVNGIINIAVFSSLILNPLMILFNFFWLLF